MREVATAISDEARAKHHEFARRGQRARYQGLTFWSPNINIFRDPRWGRGQETYGEDPYLTARMGVEFVKGLQGDDPRYLKVVATAKHYAVHSGPEKERHVFDARPSERDLYETYLPAFQALVQEAKVASVMSAYNRVNGESALGQPAPAPGHPAQRLGIRRLRRLGLRRHRRHLQDAQDRRHSGGGGRPRRRQGLRPRVRLGLQVARRRPSAKGLIAEADIDVAVRRLMLARASRSACSIRRSACATRRSRTRVNQSAEHDRLARRMAQESIVLLKNDGAAAAAPRAKKIAVIGPNADEVMTLLGNYYGTPAKPVTVLAGIRNAVAPGTKVLYARGADLVEGRQDPRAIPAIDAAYLRAPDGPPRGLRGEYFRGRELEGDARADPRRPHGGVPLGSRRRPPATSSPAASSPPTAPWPTTTSPCAGRASSCRPSPAATS